MYGVLNLIICIACGAVYVGVIIYGEMERRTIREMREDNAKTLMEHLKAFQKKNGAVILQNVSLTDRENHSAVLEKIMLTPQGIIVIREENYPCEIYGAPEAKMWYPVGGARYHMPVDVAPFPNPIKVNEKQIGILKSFLNDSTIPVYSIIVLPNESDYNGEKFINSTTQVIKINEIVYAVIKMLNGNRICLNEYKKNLYCELLKKHQLEPEEKEPHVCPICGRNMRQITAEEEPYRGMPLYVCQDYPVCHGISLIPEEITKYRNRVDSTQQKNAYWGE